MTQAKYLVGLDGRDRSHGALRLAAALRLWDKEPELPAVVGIHAIAEADLRVLSDEQGMADLIVQRRSQMWDALNDAELRDGFERIEVERGPRVQDVLASACRREQPIALIVGRRAKREEHALVRLGRVARHLVRNPPAPTVVVPRDYDPFAAGTGAILALTDLSPTSDAAMKFAMALGERLGKAVVATHCVAVPTGYAQAYVRAGTAVDTQNDAQAALGLWVAEQTDATLEQRVVLGPLVDAVLEQADNSDPFMIVTGSRKLSTPERVLLDSASSELAARARCPVVVVCSQESQS